MSEHAIEVSGLTKTFGAFTAVDQLSFTVAKGEIFGFLGANGAGKSTTIRMLCGLLQPTSGSATVGGFDITRETESVKQNIGYMSQRFSLYNDLTVEQNIRFFGGVYGLHEERLRVRMEWVLAMAGLKGREGSLTRTLSGGWKQRLALGCAILHEPPIVFLDEPTGGVDPISRRKFWELINSLSEKGTTVLVTTHMMDEAEYCNDIILINQGRLIAGGSPTQLKTEHIRLPILEVTLEPSARGARGGAARAPEPHPPADTPLAPRTYGSAPLDPGPAWSEDTGVIGALELIRVQPWALETSVFGTKLHVMVAAAKEGASLIGRTLGEADIEVARIETIMPSLEDVFLYLLEHGERNTPVSGGQS